MAKKKNKWVVPVVIVLCIALLGGGGLIFLKQTMEKATKMLNMPGQAQVSKMSIVSTVDGSGNILAADSCEIKIPTELVISETLVEVGDAVSEGDVVANIDAASITTAIVSAQNELDNINKALKDTSDMTDYEIEEYHTRQDYLNSKIEILTAFYVNPVIVATQDGVVSQIGSNSAAASSASDIDVSNYADLLGKLDPAPDADQSESTEETSESTEATEPSESSDPTEGTTPSDTVPSDTTPEANVTFITDLSDLEIAAPVNGATPQNEIEETDYYTGTITWLSVTDTFGPGTAYTAMITLSPKEGYSFDENNIPELDIAGVTAVLPNVFGGEFTALLTFAPTEGSAPSPEEQAANAVELPDDFDVNEFISAYAGGSGSPSVSDYAALYNASNTANLSALASAYSGSSTSASGRPSTNTSENMVITIASTDSVMVSIQVDELDILGVQEGQSATVSCIAIPDREFAGTITHVSNIAVSGTTKYQVDISLDMDPDMRLGMSADASIIVRESSDVLSIPLTALQQSGDENFVYTSVDEEGNLGGVVTVTTGVSDGTDVEIIGDITEGTTVYYEQSAENALAANM